MHDKFGSINASPVGPRWTWFCNGFRLLGLGDYGNMLAEEQDEERRAKSLATGIASVTEMPSWLNEKQARALRSQMVVLGCATMEVYKQTRRRVR